MTKTQTVADIYAAFGRGDIPQILAQLAPDVEWEYATTSTGVPWLEPRRGREAVVGFFQAVNDEMAFSQFAPTAIFEQGSVVVALVDATFTVKRTGKQVVEVDEAHIWHFNAQGQVARFRHRADTHRHIEAWRTGA